MKFNHLYFLIVLFSLAFIFSCSETAKLQKLQKSFIPQTLPNIYIGMTLKDLEAQRGMSKLSVVERDIITIVKEEYNKDSIALIQYQFAKDKKLYEVIIEYVPEVNANANFLAKFGAFNNGTEWAFTLDKSLKLKIWTYQNRLCIADSKHFKN